MRRGRQTRRMVGVAVVAAGLLAGAGVAVGAGAVAAGGTIVETVRPVAVREESGLVRYRIDAAHSYVGFRVRHLAVADVRGRFTRFSGYIMLDESDVTRSTVDVTVDAGSIDTSNERRDDHLRSDDFFEVERYPRLLFVGRRIERSGSGMVLVGDLTIRDVTREIRVPFELSGPVEAGNGQRVLGAAAEVRVNRFDYGLRWNRFTEAIQVVGDEVRIDLQIEARTEPARP
jgi:polyisoprenoid-binding protein YceI